MIGSDGRKLESLRYGEIIFIDPFCSNFLRYVLNENFSSFAPPLKINLIEF